MSQNTPTRPGDQKSISTPDLTKTVKKSFSLIAFALIVVVLVIVVVVVSLNHKNTTTKTNTTVTSNAAVSITKTAFIPATITVNVGQAVVWTNNDTSPHQVASDPYPTDNTVIGFNSEASLGTGQSYSFVFNKAGTYTYHDNLNPYTIKGTVIVR